METTALVIGSEGTIGRELIKGLLGNGYSVYRADKLIKSVPNYFICDIKEFETLRKVFETVRPDVVFHLAAEVGRLMADNCPMLSIQSNCIGTYNIIKYCLEYDCRLVYASSSEVYGDLFDKGWQPNGQPRTPFMVHEGNAIHKAQQGIYGLTKWMGEELVDLYTRMHDLNAVTVRYFMCYGNEISTGYRSALCEFIDKALRGKDIVAHQGAKRSWCHVDDIVNGTILAGESDLVGTVNIGKNEPISMSLLASKIRDMTNSSSNIFIEPPVENVYLIKAASFEKANKILDFDAKISIEEGLKRTIKWQSGLVTYSRAGAIAST